MILHSSFILILNIVKKVGEHFYEITWSVPNPQNRSKSGPVIFPQLEKLFLEIIFLIIRQLVNQIVDYQLL